MGYDSEKEANKIAVYSKADRAGRECVHLVTFGLGHFPYRDKNGGHTIRSVIAENPMLYASFKVCFIEPDLLFSSCDFTLTR